MSSGATWLAGPTFMRFTSLPPSLDETGLAFGGLDEADWMNRRMVEMVPLFDKSPAKTPGFAALPFAVGRWA
jgi:hypothetical protein